MPPSTLRVTFFNVSGTISLTMIGELLFFEKQYDYDICRALIRGCDVIKDAFLSGGINDVE